MNTLVVTGYLGKDPEVRNLEGGKSMVTTSIADTVYVKGEKKTVWFNVAAFGMAADVLAKHFRKGSFVVADAQIQGARSFTTQGGEEWLSIDILVDRVGFGPRQDEVAPPTARSSNSNAVEGEEIPF